MACHPKLQRRMVVEVVRHWNQIIIDLKNWAVLEQTGDYPIPSVAIAKG
ncbi:MAG: hypothetical protein BMS9Abin34_401 [Patescibacteria group bacterium]|nr:MAG: hypothetical protein BMS9Abin34_401 [Patescibacteria group bacterium]